MSSLGRTALSPAKGDAGKMDAHWLPTLADVPLFRGLSKRHLRRIASLARTRRYAAGTAIVRAGDPGTAFYVILDGTARVVPPKGRARKLHAGDFFGEMALLDGAPRSADVFAEGEVLTMWIGQTGFGRLVKKEPALAYALLRTLAARLRDVQSSD